MKKFFITALLSMLVLLGVCACTASPTESTNPTETPSPTPMLKEDLTVTDFTIVYPQKTLFSSAEPEKYSRNLWSAIMEASSAFVKVSDDEIMTKQEIMDMKKEMARIKEENEILKKAMTIFATKR